MISCPPDNEIGPNLICAVRMPQRYRLPGGLSIHTLVTNFGKQKRAERYSSVLFNSGFSRWAGARRSVGGGETGEVGFGLGVTGLNLECALVGGTRGGGLASSGEHDAEVVPAIGILRVDLQGALLFREASSDWRGCRGAGRGRSARRRRWE